MGNRNANQIDDNNRDNQQILIPNDVNNNPAKIEKVALKIEASDNLNATKPGEYKITAAAAIATVVTAYRINFFNPFDIFAIFAGITGPASTVSDFSFV